MAEEKKMETRQVEEKNDFQRPSVGKASVAPRKIPGNLPYLTAPGTLKRALDRLIAAFRPTNSMPITWRMFKVVRGLWSSNDSFGQLGEIIRANYVLFGGILSNKKRWEGSCTRSIIFVVR